MVNKRGCCFISRKVNRSDLFKQYINNNIFKTLMLQIHHQVNKMGYTLIQEIPAKLKGLTKIIQQFTKQ